MFFPNTTEQKEILLTFSTAYNTIRSLTKLLALGIAHITRPGELAKLPKPALLTDAPSTWTVTVTWRWRAEGPSFKRRQNMEHGHEKTLQIQEKFKKKEKKKSKAFTSSKSWEKCHRRVKKTAIKNINTGSWQCRHRTLTLIGSTRRQSYRKMRERRSKLIVFPLGTWKELSSLVLSCP